jgi:hypothetical protein
MMLESKLFWHNNIIIQGYLDVQDPIKYLPQVNLLVDSDILISFISECILAGQDDYFNEISI